MCAGGVRMMKSCCEDIGEVRPGVLCYGVIIGM